MNTQIEIFSSPYSEKVANMIITIQRDEFEIPISLQDQPDLLDIQIYYQRGKGNFWIAMHQGAVVGSIGLLDIGHDMAALRKMFVAKEYRGKDKGIAQALLDTAFSWCKASSIQHIYLGTIEKFAAAIRFYEKNGFEEIPQSALPASFPLMKVDHRFFHAITG
jgi:N-acetylglutamate synthase-like GNAT family acetyltransferase